MRTMRDGLACGARSAPSLVAMGASHFIRLKTKHRAHLLDTEASTHRVLRHQYNKQEAIPTVNISALRSFTNNRQCNSIRLSQARSTLNTLNSISKLRLSNSNTRLPSRCTTILRLPRHPIISSRHGVDTEVRQCLTRSTKRMLYRLNPILGNSIIDECNAELLSRSCPR